MLGRVTYDACVGAGGRPGSRDPRKPCPTGGRVNPVSEGSRAEALPTGVAPAAAADASSPARTLGERGPAGRRDATGHVTGMLSASRPGSLQIYDADAIPFPAVNGPCHLNFEVGATSVDSF